MRLGLPGELLGALVVALGEQGAGLLQLGAGELLAQSATADVVDAVLALLTRPGDRVLTSDPDDLRHLTTTLGVAAVVVPV